MTYAKQKLYIHKDTGIIFEAGEYCKPICPGIVRYGRYVKYGNHGKQIRIGYNIDPKYCRYIGRV